MDLTPVIVLLLVYVVPTLIALARRTQMVALVCMVNVLLGWTGVGWAVSLALAMLLPGDRAPRKQPAAVPVGEQPSGPPRELEFLLSPVRVAALSIAAPVVYWLWWFWRFFQFAREEGFPRARSFWWIFVPFYGWAVIGRLFHDLEARLHTHRQVGFDAQIAVAMVVGGIVALAATFRLPMPFSLVGFGLSVIFITAALYRVQIAVNALLEAAYPGGFATGVAPEELVAAAAGVLLAGTLALGAAPDVHRFTTTMSDALASGRLSSNAVKPVVPPTNVATIPTSSPTDPSGPVLGTGILTLTSEPGDYIGQGKSMTMTGATWRFVVTRYYGPETIQITAQGNPTEWTVNLAAPKGRRLQPGSFASAEVLNTASTPGIDVSGDGRACNRTYGTFTITTMTMDGGGQIKAFEASFEQHCESPTAPALRGSIRFDAAAIR